MRQPSGWPQTGAVRYALYGALLGWSIPLGATWLAPSLQGLPVTGTPILPVRTPHLHWVIDAAPLLLGVLAGLAGTWYHRRSWRTARSSTANQELREQEERDRSLFENANDGIFIVSRDGRFVAVNRRYTEMTGLRQEELLGQTSEILLPGSLTQSLERIEQTIRAGTLGPYELEVTTPLGKKIFSLNSVAHSENRTPVGIMCIVRDVTEERRCKEQEALYQLAHDLARSADVLTMADHLFAQVQSLLGADYGFLLLANAEGNELRGVAACGVNLAAFRQERIAVRAELAPVAQAFQQRRPVVVTDFAHSPLVSARLREQYRFLGSVWVVPLMHGEAAVGGFAVGYATHREATTEELRCLQLLGDEAALAIERARLTEELRESEERYHGLFENAGDAIMTCTLEGTITSLNRGTEVLLGWARDELIGHHYRKITSPATLAVGQERTRRALAGEKLSPTFEAEQICKDGRVIVTELRDRLIRTPEGQPLGFQVICRDITARKQMEEELARLSSAVRTSTDSIVLTDLEGRILEANEVTLALHGVDDKGDLIGKSAFDFIAPEDQERAFAGMKEVLERGYVKGREYSVIRKNGSTIPVEMSVSIIKNAAGTPLGFAGISRDLTARKQAEESIRIYAEIVRNMQIGLYVYHLEDINDDSTLRLVAANPAAAQFTGVAMEGVVGKTLDENFPGLRAQGIPQMYAEVVRSGQAVEREDLSYGDDRVLHGAFAVKAFPLPNQCMGVVFENITARKQTAEALRESEARLRTVVTSAPIVLFTVDREGVFTLREGKGLEGLGLKSQEVLGRSVFDVYRNVPQIVNNIRRALAGEEFAATVKVGQLTFETRHCPLRDQQGAVTGVIGVAIDITERQQAEEALREREARYRQLFENANDAIFIVDPQGRILAVNHRVVELTGIPKEQIIGQTTEIFLPGAFARSLARIQQVMREGKLGPYELEFTTPLGKKLFSLSAFSYYEGGTPVGVINIGRDLTERKRMEEALRHAEEQYRSIFENAIEGLFQTSPTGVILAANPALARMLGYDSPDELRVQVTNVATQVYVDPHRRAEILGMLKEHDIVRGVEVECYRKDGSTFWASLNIQAIRDATGATLCCDGSIEDISQRRAVDQLKDEFVSVVSHELRTPLTSIRGSLGLLASGMLGLLPDKGQRMLDIALRNTDRLVRLINDILDVERIQSGKISMVKTRCNLADLMTRAGDEMQGMAEKAGVTLVIQPAQAQLWVDPDRLMQTLTNLLSNAIKFSLAGTTVWLRAERQGEHLLVQVEDQGRGIPTDKLESIFERFQQVDASDSREKGGTGLGLAICRSIVHQHGGRIWAESTLGAGSTFSVTLPLANEARPATPACSSSGPLLTPGSEKVPLLVARSGQTRRLQVLVAEDDRDLARVLMAMFERHGAVVYYAQTGTEAIQCCDFVVPDLLLLDPVMPDQDGFAVVDWMRQREPLCQMPIVVYAAGELTAAEQQQLTLGPTQFFTKSRLPLEQLEQQVMHWLAGVLPASEECDA